MFRQLGLLVVRKGSIVGYVATGFVRGCIVYGIVVLEQSCRR